MGELQETNRLRYTFRFSVEHQTVQMDVQVSGRAESLYQRDRAGVGCGALQASLLAQKPRDDAVDDAQHRREQLGVYHEQQGPRGRKRQHPLPDRHARDDLIDQVRSALRHAPRDEREWRSAYISCHRSPLA